MYRDNNELAKFHHYVRVGTNRFGLRLYSYIQTISSVITVSKHIEIISKKRKCGTSNFLKYKETN